MGKRSTKNNNYFSLLYRNKQGLNRYISTSRLEKQVLHILEHVVKKEGQKMNYSFVDSMLLYLPGQEYPKKVQNDIEEEKESALETELEDPVQLKEEDDFAPVRYLPLDENLQDIVYNGKVANDNIYGSIASLLPDDEEYEVTSPANDNYAELSTDEEAKENLIESKYDFITSVVDVDYEEQQKLALWIQFNPALFAFLESFYGLSRDVDYRLAA